MEQYFQDWPSILVFHQSPGTWGEDKCVPCCDGQSTDKEVLVCAQVGRQVKVGGKLVSERHDGGSEKKQSCARLSM
jgi:hypothetical protein